MTTRRPRTKAAAVEDKVVEEARAAGLRYVNDVQEGIRRLGKNGDFRYVDAKGRRIRDREILARIKSLVIPPAWTDVWISPIKNGHLQATGRDARGRKQYRYHPEWRARRDEAKFQHMLAFARALPKIRRRVKRDLRRNDSPRLKILATIVRLLEVTLIRVGNDEYARQNGSYGLTTMRKRHVKVKGMRVSFSFRGKSGKRHEVGLEDRQLAKVVRRCQDLPGQELFGYLDEQGIMRDIGSQDVNAYLREIAGDDFTAKDFRTWSGTVLAAMALKEFEEVTSQTEAKKNIVAAIEAVAKMLGNTPTVCRKCYVHPDILDSYLEGATTETIRQRISPKLPHLRQLQPDEAAVFVLLQRRLKMRGRTQTRTHVVKRG
jgi:DNA topoisomerase-1